MSSTTRSARNAQAVTSPTPSPSAPASNPPALEAPDPATYTSTPTGQVAQLVEHRIENAGVAGSSPALPIRTIRHDQTEREPPQVHSDFGGVVILGLVRVGGEHGDWQSWPPRGL